MGEIKPRSLVDTLTRLQIVELDACARCGECLNWCPAYEVTEDRFFNPQEKIAEYRSFVGRVHGIKAKIFGPRGIDEEALKEFANAVYECTTCGVCQEVCKVGIKCQKLWPAIRAKMVELGLGPMEEQKKMPEVIGEKRNPYNRPPEDRFDWLPRDIKIADNAEVGYFAGCTGSYQSSPMVEGAVRVLHATETEFTMLGAEEEWCCGFPLFIVGLRDLIEEHVEHNVEAFASRGIERLVTSCPCCTYMIKDYWPKFYGGKLPFELMHITQIIAEKIEEGKLRLTKSLQKTITFHDACYLSRGTGIVEEPRKIIDHLPGVKFIEMERNRKLTKCCGAGGGIRRAYSDLSFDMSLDLIKDAEEIGAEILVVDCPACYERLPLAVYMRKYETSLKIMDLMQLTADLL